jgi:hypothetical protein
MQAIFLADPDARSQAQGTNHELHGAQPRQHGSLTHGSRKAKLRAATPSDGASATPPGVKAPRHDPHVQAVGQRVHRMCTGLADTAHHGGVRDARLHRVRPDQAARDAREGISRTLTA